MSHNNSIVYQSLYLNYDDLIKNEQAVIQYAAKYSEAFSFITILKKPYSENPYTTFQDALLLPLEPFLLKRIVGVKEWLGTRTSAHNRGMFFYRTCRESRRILQEMPNLFVFQDKTMPEDITFYRKGRPWLATTSHEKTASALNVTKEDIAFFQEYGIKVRACL